MPKHPNRCFGFSNSKEIRMINTENWEKGWKKLRDRWNEEPVQVIIVGTLAVGAVAKLIDSISAAQGRNAYAKQVNHRVRNQ
jgi:hypothetical protein